MPKLLILVPSPNLMCSQKDTSKAQHLAQHQICIRQKLHIMDDPVSCSTSSFRFRRNFKEQLESTAIGAYQARMPAALRPAAGSASRLPPTLADVTAPTATSAQPSAQPQYPVQPSAQQSVRRTIPPPGSQPNSQSQLTVLVSNRYSDQARHCLLSSTH